MELLFGELFDLASFFYSFSKCIHFWSKQSLTLIFSPLDRSDNHMLQFTCHLIFLQKMGFIFKLSKFQIIFNLITWWVGQPLQLFRQTNEGLQAAEATYKIRLSDSKSYLEMSSNTWLVSDLARLTARSKLCIYADWLWYYRIPEPWFNVKMLPHQYRKSHCGDKMILWSSYLHNGISYTGKRLLYIELGLRSQIQGYPLQWSHNERDGVSNHQPHDCLLKLALRCRSKKTSKLRVTSLCVGNSPVTGEFPAQRASNAKNVSSWWRHHSFAICSSSVAAAHSRSFLGGFSEHFSCMEFDNLPQIQ